MQTMRVRAKLQGIGPWDHSVKRRQGEIIATKARHAMLAGHLRVIIGGDRTTRPSEKLTATVRIRRAK